MSNTLEYLGFILDVYVHSDDYLIGRIRKNKYFPVASGVYYDVSGVTVKELREVFEKKVDEGLKEYYEKQKELEKSNSIILTYKDFKLRVSKDSSGKLIGSLPGTNMAAPTFKGQNIERVRASFEKYIDKLLEQVNIHYQLVNYNKSGKQW